MKNFNENTRVQVPAALHLCKLGYTYMDNIANYKSGSADKVILIDASKLGEEYKDGNNQKKRLRDFEIDYVDITAEEFNQRMVNYKVELAKQFAESHRLEDEIMKQLDNLGFNDINH